MEETTNKEPITESFDLGKEGQEYSIAIIKTDNMIMNTNNIISRFIYESAENVYSDRFEALNARAADYMMYKSNLIEQVKSNLIPTIANEHPEILNSCYDFQYNPSQNSVTFLCNPEKYEAIKSELEKNKDENKEDASVDNSSPSVNKDEESLTNDNNTYIAADDIDEKE